MTLLDAAKYKQCDKVVQYLEKGVSRLIHCYKYAIFHIEIKQLGVGAYAESQLWASHKRRG